MIGPKHFNLN